MALDDFANPNNRINLEDHFGYFRQDLWRYLVVKLQFIQRSHEQTAKSPKSSGDGIIVLISKT
jgi:hypothetical protein